MIRFVCLLLLLLVVTPATISAEKQESLLPDIPRGQGESCVAESSFMRKNHMHLLKHDRDLTVYQGLRDIDFSLKGCIECHAVSDKKTGEALTIKDEKHFCRSCHDFAAVTMDCFQCHASRPEPLKQPMKTQMKQSMPDDATHQRLIKKGAEQ